MQNTWTMNIKQYIRYHTRITHDKFRTNKIRNGRQPSIFLLSRKSCMIAEADIKKLIMKSKSTSSDLDPFPTSLLKDCLDVLIEPITSITNKSLQ